MENVRFKLRISQTRKHEKGKIWSHGSNSCLPFAMNVTLNLSSTADKSPLGESAGYTYVYRSYFLKKLWCCIDGAVKEKNGLSTELIKSNYNPKEIEKLSF